MRLALEEVINEDLMEGKELRWVLVRLFIKCNDNDKRLLLLSLTECLQIRKEVLSPCLFNLHAEYIMQNGGLDEAQAGIKIARRNINNLRYADDTTLMTKSEEQLKSLLMKVKEESEKFG